MIRGLECGADNFLRKPYDERYRPSRIDYLREWMRGQVVATRVTPRTAWSIARRRV